MTNLGWAWKGSTESKPLKKKKRHKAAKQKRKKWRKDKFYDSQEWKEARYAALVACGGKCLCCGASAADGAQLHVDHIKPRWKYPRLELEITNLQVLCGWCNVGKGGWNDTDWRTDEQRQQLEHMRNL